MTISRESFILAKKDPTSGVAGEPVGLSQEGGPPSIALMSTIDEAMQLRSQLREMGALGIFKVHVVLVGEVICPEN
jgi:hypothetical protein